MDEVEMPLREARAALGRRVDAAHYAGEITVITKNGEPRAALVPVAKTKPRPGATAEVIARGC